MSDTDSFIDEVSEEIRREKLFTTFRKYGWIGVALVVIVVGGTGYREYSRAAEKTASETFGSSVLERCRKTSHPHVLRNWTPSRPLMHRRAR